MFPGGARLERRGFPAEEYFGNPAPGGAGMAG